MSYRLDSHQRPRNISLGPDIARQQPRVTFVITLPPMLHRWIDHHPSWTEERGGDVYFTPFLVSRTMLKCGNGIHEVLTTAFNN